MTRPLFVLMALLGSTATLSAQDLLTWKFQQNEQFYLVQVVEQSQSVSIGGQLQQKSNKQSNITKFRVLAVRPTGGADLEMEMVSIKQESNGVEVVNDMNKRMEGAKFQVTLNAKNEVSQLKGYDEFTKRVSAGDPNLLRMFRVILSEDSFKTTNFQAFAMIPGIAANPGDSWYQKQSMSLGPLGSVSSDHKISHAGEIPTTDGRTLIKLLMTGTGKYAPPAERFAGVPFEIVSGNLQFKTIEGEAIFDVGRGRIDRFQSSISMTGTMTVKAGEQTTEMVMQQKQSGLLRVLDKLPEE